MQAWGAQGLDGLTLSSEDGLGVTPGRSGEAGLSADATTSHLPVPMKGKPYTDSF